MPVYVDVISRLDERAAAATAKQIERQFSTVGVTVGKTTGNSLTDAIDKATNRAGAGLTTQFSGYGAQAGRSFGSSFDTSVARSIPATGGFNTAVNGYTATATKAGTAAGRALGTAFTLAAGGLIGAAGLTLFKGFERYQSIDAAKNRLENLNRTLQGTGRAGLDVGAVMDTVTKAVTDTPFALDQAFSVATRALASNTGDLQRFMTVVTDAAGFAGAGVDEIGNAFLKVANTGKVSMEEIGNELRNIPILPWLQQQLGVTGGELQKLISDGKVGLDDLMKAVENNASGFAKASGDTIAGAMQNMQTAVARIGANLLGSVFGKPTEDGNDLVDVLKTVRMRLDDVNAWITANQGRIRDVFQQGVQVAGDLADAVKWILDQLDRMGIGIDDVVKAFVAWKVIGGVTALSSQLTSINTLLATTLPASAATGAAGITSALARIAPPLWLSTLIEDKYPNFPIQDQPTGEDRLFPGWVPILPFWEDKFRDWNSEDPLQTGAAGAPGPLTGPNGIFDPTPGGEGGPAGASRERRGNTTPSEAAGPSPAGNPILPAPGLGDGSGGKLPKAPVVPYDTTLPPGIPGMPADPSVFAAESSFLDARHALAEKRARLTQLEASVDATDEDRLNARNDVIAEERDFQAAEMRMHEARQSQLEKLTKQVDGATSSLSELGAELDKDFGISKGLGGIVENFVKAAGNILAAPFLQALGLIEQANPNEGSGLVGMLAANGVFGSQYTPAALQAAQMGPTALQPGMPTGVPGMGGAPTEAQVKQIASAFGLQVTSEDRPGDPGYHGQGMALDVSNGSGNTPQMRAFAEYMSTNFGPHLKELIYSDGSFAGNIGDGQNVSGTGYYSQGTLSDHENHVHIAAAWGDGATQAAGALTNLASAAQQVTGSFSGSGGLASSLFQDGSGRWRSALPGWDHLIQRESSGINQVQGITDVNSGGNEAEGLFQITPQTWAANGGTAYAPSAITASPQQQAMIASNIFANNPTGSDWGMGLAGRENPAQLQAELGQYGGGGSMLPGVGAPMSMPFGGPAAAPGVGGGIAYPSQGGNSGNIMGGLALDGAMAATAGLDMMMPGAGAAAKIGIQLANRTIGYAAQNAGIAASGILETLSLGDNPKGSLGGGWIGKIAGGIAGAAPALPNLAGGQKAPLPGGEGQQPGAANNTTNINVKNEKATEDQTGKVIAEHQAAMQAPPGRQP